MKKKGRRKEKPKAGIRWKEKPKAGVTTSVSLLAGRRRSFPKLTPKRTVCFVACAVALIVAFGGDARRWWQSSPRIMFEARAEEKSQRVGREKGRAAQTPVFDGEVYRTEGRLREASAVSVAASLAFIARAAERRPVTSVGELLSEIERRNLLPPGVEFVANRLMLASERSVIHLRLRPEPFGVEVVSLGRERADGPALLLRVPEEETFNSRSSGQATGTGGAPYFRSLRLDDVRVPEPFAIASRVRAAGWEEETLSAELSVGASPQNLARWAEERRAASLPDLPQNVPTSTATKPNLPR